MTVVALTGPSLADVSTVGRAFAELRLGIDELASSLRSGTLTCSAPPSLDLPPGAFVDVGPLGRPVGWVAATSFAKEAVKTGVVVLVAYHALLWFLPDPARPELGGAPSGTSPVVLEVVPSLEVGAPLAPEAAYLEVDRDGQATSGSAP